MPSRYENSRAALLSDTPTPPVQAFVPQTVTLGTGSGQLTLIQRPNDGPLQTVVGGGESWLPPGFNPVQTTIPPAFQPRTFSQEIREMHQQQLQAQKLAARNKADSSKAAIERQRGALDPQFHREKVEADTAAVVAGRRLSERLSTMGLGGSGENISAGARLEAARQGAFSDIVQRRTQAHQTFDQHQADIEMALANDVQQLYAAVGAQEAQALLQDLMRHEQMRYQVHRDSVGDSQWERQFGEQQRQSDAANNRWTQEFGFQQQRANVGDSQWERQFGEQQRQSDAANNRWTQEFGFQQQRANVGDSQWERQFGEQQRQSDAANNRWTQELEWSRSADNPAVRRQILDNRIRELEAAHLPEIQRLQLDQIKQDLARGTVNLEQARVQLNAIKTPEAPKATDTLSLVKHYINQIERDFKMDNYVDLPAEYVTTGIWPFRKSTLTREARTREQQREADIKRYIENLEASGVPTEVLRELMRSLGLSGQIIR